MRSTSSLQIVAALAVIAALMALAVRLQRERDVRYRPPETADETLYLTSGPALQRLTLGYRSLAADVYWIRAVQHFGGTRLALSGERRASDVPAAAGAERYALLYPLLDLTTTLDPRFNIAYRFGAVFLAEPYPGGSGRSDLAIALLEKGLRERPDKWEYMHDIGFVHYWWRQDYTQAADWFLRASQAPGAPEWLRPLAATTLAMGGDRQSSRVLWESIHDSAELDWLRRIAERRLLQLEAMDQIDQAQQTLRAGRSPGVTLDPTGTPYEIDETGTVRLSSRSPLYPLPDEPQRTAAAQP
jgi:hypothetical protein